MNKKTNKSKTPPKGRGHSILIVVFAIAILLGVFFIIRGAVTNTFQPGSDLGAGDVVSPQVWELRSSDGQIATVAITPFVNSGTFSETSDRAGWFVNIPGANPIRLPVSGSIVHDSTGDRWEFTQSVAQGGVLIQYRDTGTANGQFPSATQVTGTVQGTITTPMGSQTVSGTWSGRRI